MINYNLRYYPWATWQDWLATKNQVQSDPQSALETISNWVNRNSPMTQSSPHLKYLKMQKIMLQQKLLQSNLETSNLRLIQLVEMGASTSKYRKSKLGGKIAMKNIAEELNFPKTLVTLRHQAVHECRDGSMHSQGVLKYAFNLIQEFLDENYWKIVEHTITKRQHHLQDFTMKLKLYQVHQDSKYKLPMFSEMKNEEERTKVLQKFTKANLKLSRLLDGNQLVSLLDCFVQTTLDNTQITITDPDLLKRIVKNFTIQEMPIKSQFKLKSELICFLFVFEQKYSPRLITSLLYTNLIQRMCETAKKNLDQVDFTQSLRLISFNSLLQQTLSLKFKDLCQDVPMGIVKTYTQLVILSQVDYFALRLKAKLEFGKTYKANCDRVFETPQAFGQHIEVEVMSEEVEQVQQVEMIDSMREVIDINVILNW